MLMTTDQEVSSKYVNAIAAILSSLRLRDILDAIVVQYAHLARVNKVAVFLADNQGKFFRLMAAKGYSEFSLQHMKLVRFNAEGILSEILKTHSSITFNLESQFTGFNKTVFDKEQSVNQMAWPLKVNELLVGAVLVDSSIPLSLDDEKIWQSMTDLTASAVANAIIFGRSEYERERLGTLYTTLAAFQASALSLTQVLQRIADAALILGNTPYCAILSAEQDEKAFKLASFKGLDGASLSEFNLAYENTMAGKALAEGKTQHIKRVTAEMVGMPKAMGGVLFTSILALPLTYNDKKLGVLEIFSTEEAAFQHEQIALLEALASQSSNAIYIAQNHQSALGHMVYDPHTGLLNRLNFESNLRAELERSHRHKHQFTLWLIDIDYLSRVNDKFGEEKGDEVIARIAQAVKQTLREIDLVYRFGGEQFAVILPETPRETISTVVERVREKIKNTLIPDVGAVTVSIGVSAYPDHSKEVYELLNLAEEALFIAKYKGRDRVVEAPIAALGADTNTWEALANHAKKVVSQERQERAKSHLSSNADYAGWFLKT